MVTGNKALQQYEIRNEKDLKKDYTFLPEQVKVTTVSLKEIINNKTRLEASAFNLDAKNAKQKLLDSSSEIVELWSDKGFVKECYYGGRAKRNYVSKNVNGAVGFLGSAEMLEIKPKPTKFLPSLKINISQFKIEEGTILISRSGTIGNVTFVNKTLAKHLVSEHAIRIIPKNFGGYIYSYLKTDLGKTLVKANTFGAVVDQIEPEHLKNVLIPNPSDSIKEKIHNLIISSFADRDKSNELLDEAEKILYQELQLSPLEELKPNYFDSSKKVRNYNTKLSDLQLRFDASFHVPQTQAIINALKIKAKEITCIGDERISKEIILPGRFKRTYVDSEEHGIPFFGGKQLLELNPSNIKYLSRLHHNNRISKQLFLKQNTIAVTCSGTIGKVNIIPKHWENWTLNQHVMRIIPKSENIAGYIFCWLNTEIGKKLITRHVYGSVVDEIDDRHLSKVEIPLLKDESKQKQINDLVLQANEVRYQAHLKEQQAIKEVEKIINTPKNSISLFPSIP